MEREEAVRLINQQSWKHSFEILPGVITPGAWDYLDVGKFFDTHYNLPSDLRGVRALDIGALDGVYTFELERRGAAVTALDIQSPDVSGFGLARRILGSKADYVQGSVYHLSQLLPKREFDLICFFGVWYHLRNPVGAFEEIAKVLSDDGTLLLEGECLVDYAEIPGKNPAELRDFVRQLASSDLAISLYYPDQCKGDYWTWYVPNLASIRAWCKTAGLELLSHSFWSAPPHFQRLQGTAKKNKGLACIVENPVW